MLSIMVVAFWLLMSDSFTLGQIVLGLVLGVVVPLFAARRTASSRASAPCGRCPDWCA